MEDSDETLRRKHNVTQAAIDEAEDARAQHAFFLSVGKIISGKPATGEQQRALNYLKERDELEARRKQTSVMWMLVFSHSDGSMHAIEVKLDSGAEQNFITESMVSNLSLRKKMLEKPQEFISAQDAFTCTCKVQLKWESIDKEMNDTEFLVLPPTSQIEKPIVREDLIEELRSKLFIENPKKSVAYAAQKKMTAEETARVQSLREQAAADRAESSRKKEAFEQKKRKESHAGQTKTGTPSKRPKK